MESEHPDNSYGRDCAKRDDQKSIAQEGRGQLNSRDGSESEIDNRSMGDGDEQEAAENINVSKSAVAATQRNDNDNHAQDCSAEWE